MKIFFYLPQIQLIQKSKDHVCFHTEFSFFDALVLFCKKHLGQATFQNNGIPYGRKKIQKTKINSPVMAI